MSKKIPKFINSIYDLFDIVPQREYSKLKAICEDPLAREEYKNTAKRKLNTLYSKKLNGFTASPQLNDQLERLSDCSKNPQQLERDICISIRFLYVSQDGLLRIRPEESSERYLRYVWFFLGSVLFCLFMSLVSRLIWSDLQFKTAVWEWLLSYCIFIFSFTLFFQTAYIYSIKRIQEEITFISNNKNLDKKSKLRSWFNNLKRK